MRTISVIILLVLLMTIPIIPASAQVYVPLVVNRHDPQRAAQPDTVAEILAALAAEGSIQSHIEAVRRPN
ncbi:MAG: hypothetical protein R2867_09790 [Caldilineaceae bacterium]